MATNNKKTQQSSTNNNDLVSKFDIFFGKRQKLFFIISLLSTIFFAILIFNHNVSAGGDDSAYLIRSFNFIKKFEFPTFQGPLYPIVLSPFIAIFGVNIVILKTLSLIFILIHLYFLHITFKDKIPASIHSMTILLISISSPYLYFASQTYVEAFYLMIQSIGIWYFVKYFTEKSEVGFEIKRDYKRYLILGFVILLMGLTRSVGYAMLVVVLIYFAIYKKWSSMPPVVGGFGILYVVYSLLKRIIWGVTEADFSSQGKGLLYKNYYNPAEGKEDLIGFIQRFWDNSNLYLSKHLYVFLGIRESQPVMKIMPWLTILTYILFVVAIFYVIKKNRQILLAALYVGIFCSATFIMVQKSWDQARLVIPYFPMITITLLTAIYYLLKEKTLSKIQLIFPLLFAILMLSSFLKTSEQAKANSELKGPWYGLTPDWINYIKCCRWADKNIPKDVAIASRKPSISFVYTKGREFVGIYKFDSKNTAEVFNSLEDSAYVIFSFSEMATNNVNPQVQMFLRQQIEYILNNNGQIIGIVKPEKTQYNSVLSLLKQVNINYSVNPLQYYTDNKLNTTENYTVSPDELLGVFQKSDVEYLVKASLRIIPHQKTDRTINTINRYLFFIEQKYPGIFTKMAQLGEDNDEPATLYKINYASYGLEK